MTIFARLSELPNVSRINLHKEAERLFYKKIINNSGLENCYFNSWAYIWQIAGGNSFKYYDGAVLLSLTPAWGESFPDELTINSKQNPVAAETAVKFARAATAFFKRPIYIRKIYDKKIKTCLIDKKLKQIPKFQKNSNICLLPDDNFPERVINISDQLEHCGKRYQCIRTNRNHFLHSADPALLDIKEDYPAGDYLSLLDRWSRDISMRLCKRNPEIKYKDVLAWVRSPYPELYAFFDKYKNEEDIYSFMAYYDKEPAGIMCACKISSSCVSLYANYSLTKPDGFPYYHAILISEYLKGKGFTHVNQGGSEIAGLDFFKKKCGGFLKIYPESFIVEPKNQLL